MDLYNDRMPTFDKATVHSGFPLVQTPSTRRRGSFDDVNMEERFRRTIQAEDDDEELSRLADSVARIHRTGLRPQTLKRHETV